MASTFTPATESNDTVDSTAAVSMSENSTCSGTSDLAAESVPDLPPIPPEPVDPIPMPSSTPPPLPPLPSSPVPPPEPDSAPPLPLSPPPMPPTAIGYSPYPKIPVSIHSATPSYCYPPAVPNMPFMPYPAGPYPPMAYGSMMAPNGAMYDFMSTMAGMSDYSAFTVAPNANNYGYKSVNENAGTGQR